MDPNYVAIVKQHLNKLLNTSFIASVEEASWLSPIVVVPKKMTSSIFTWISDDSMMQPRKIQIFYLL
jgi:hypothetical protein